MLGCGRQDAAQQMASNSVNLNKTLRDKYEKKFHPSQPSLRFVVKYLRNFSVSIANSCWNCGHYDIRLLWTSFPFFSRSGSLFRRWERDGVENFFLFWEKSVKGVKSTNNCSFFLPSSSRPFDWSTMKIIGRKKRGKSFPFGLPERFPPFARSFPNRMSKQSSMDGSWRFFSRRSAKSFLFVCGREENKGLKVLNESDKKCKSSVIP